MVDCHKTAEFLKEWKKMCIKGEANCGIRKRIASCLDCQDYACDNPQKAINIIQKWSDAKPIKTRQSELLKVFPNATLYKDGIPVICPIALEGEGFGCDDDGDGSLCDKCYQEYWLAEVE